MNTFDNHNHKIRKSAIYRLATMVISILLLVTAIAAGSNYGVSVASGQLASTQPSGGNATTTTGGNATTGTNATTTTASACMTQTAGQNATTSTPAGNMTTAGNATTTAAGGNITGPENATAAASQAASDARMHIEEACMALQNNDTQGVLMHLNLAITSLDSVQGNLTATTAAANATNATATSAAPVTNQTSGGNNQTNPLEQLGKLFGGK